MIFAELEIDEAVTEYYNKAINGQLQWWKPSLSKEL
jgi:hypothetical protein